LALRQPYTAPKGTGSLDEVDSPEFRPLFVTPLPGFYKRLARPARGASSFGRNLRAIRELALREFALGIEALERFVRREPLRRVHECVFGVLALESEPVDPRL
jgi:hypothetical protein